jgi:hypothetical protein
MNGMSLPSIDTKLVKELRTGLRKAGLPELAKEVSDVILRFDNDWSGDPATYVDVVLDVKNEANWHYQTYHLVEDMLRRPLKADIPENFVYFAFIDKTDVPNKFPELMHA